MQRNKEVKVAAMRTLWIAAVNNHGGFGRWDYIEIEDPWDARSEIVHRFRRLTQI